MNRLIISSAPSDYTDSKIKMSFTILERFDVAGSSRDLTIFNYLFIRRITLDSDSLVIFDVKVWFIFKREFQSIT